MRKIILLLTLLAGLAPAVAQVPPPVPTLPDAERRISYSIAGTTCACSLGANLNLYGDGTDFASWVEVFLNGVRVNFNDATFGWTITSQSGTPLANLPRPITDGLLTFTNPQTGTVQIVGARRPRRLSTFAENQGIPARNFNQILNDMIAQNREVWDKINDVTGRAILGLPGENIGPLPSAGARAGSLLAFDAFGNPVATTPGPGTGNVVGPGSSVNNDIACWNGTSGALLKDCAATASSITYTAPYTSAVTQTQTAYNAQRVSINDFGGVGDGATNNDAAFTRAMGQTPPIAVYIPCGTYNVSNSITITQANTEIFGQGMGCSIIRSTSANNAVIHANTSLTTVQIHDLTIDRTTTATSGGDGIDYSLVGDKTILANLYVQHQFNGIDIGNTGFSFVNNVTTINNVNNGFVGTNGASGAVGLQWQLDNIISQSNGANGFLFTCNGTGSMSIGQHKGLASFSNTSKGIAYQGSGTCPINGVRLIDSFFGGDAGNEILLDTFGTFPHTITHVATELNSAGPCISVTVNNPAVSILNGTSNGCAGNGITSAGPTLGVIGGNYSNNTGIGISVSGAGTIRIVGAKIGGSPQTNGITLAAAAINGVVADNDVSGTGGNITNSSTGATLRIIDNTGYNPVGLTAGTSTGTSASTITAGPSPETHYITQSANFNAVIKSGATSLCTVPTATVPCVIQLGPNEAYTVTWTTTQPTYSKFVH